MFVLKYIGMLLPIGLLINGCSGTASNNTWMPVSNPPDSVFAGPLTSTAEDFNRNLAVLATRDAVASDYTIGAQDLLEVSLFNIDGTDGLPNKVQVRVNNEGSVTLPVLGQVKASGMTRMQLEDSLKKRYATFMHEPDVGVTLVENRSKSVYVLGAVKNPGVVPVTGQETLRRLLAMAGGLSTDSGMFVHVSRQLGEEEQGFMISLQDLANDKTGKFNLTIRAGDFINVPRAGTFYVDGYVERPNAYPLNRQYRLSEVVALAGGLAPYAKGSEVTVFRRGPESDVKVLYRDLEKIRNGQEEDIQIAENDLVVVPPSTAKIIISAVLSSVGYTARGSSYSMGIGRTGRMVIP